MGFPGAGFKGTSSVKYKMNTHTGKLTRSFKLLFPSKPHFHSFNLKGSKYAGYQYEYNVICVMDVCTVRGLFDTAGEKAGMKQCLPTHLLCALAQVQQTH